MAARSLFKDMMKFKPMSTRETCLADARNRSSQMTIPHCPPEWDLYAELCWEPTPAGETAILPCPNDGFLNAHQFATRLCLPDATWYINYTVNDKPYTNFDDCFLPPDPSAEDDLKKLVDTKIIFVLKSIDEYKSDYLVLHIVSIILLVASAILCATGVFKLRQQNYLNFSYTALTVSTVALLINHIVSVSVSAVDDATKVVKCRGAKTLVLFSTLVFYEFLLGYIYMCIVPILRFTIRPQLMKITIAATVTMTVMLVLAELLFETFSCSTKFCGFKTLQSPFHWLTTAPKILMVMTHACLTIVIAFGVMLLKHPHLCKGSEICYIRQKAISALVMVMYNVIQEILLVLIHTEAYMNYSDLPIQEYLKAFSFVTAVQGAIFSVLMCILDLGLLAMLGVSFYKPLPNAATSERELNTFEVQLTSRACNSAENTRGIEYQIVPQNVGYSVEHNRAEQAIGQRSTVVYTSPKRTLNF